MWANGLYSGLRGTDDRLCVLVVIGVKARGEKHFLAIEDGVRESPQSWRRLRGFAHLIQGVDFINGIKPGSSRRMRSARTPDLTIARDLGGAAQAAANRALLLSAL